MHVTIGVGQSCMHLYVQRITYFMHKFDSHFLTGQITKYQIVQSNTRHLAKLNHTPI